MSFVRGLSNLEMKSPKPLPDISAYISEDEALLLEKTLESMTKDITEQTETKLAAGYLKAKKLKFLNLKSATEHGSYRNVRNGLVKLGFLGRKDMSNLHTLYVTASGIQALRYRRNEVFKPKTHSESRVYLDQIKPISESSKEACQLFRRQPTITTMNEVPKITVTIDVMGAHYSTQPYDDSTNRMVAAEADLLGGSIDVYSSHNFETEEWERLSAKLTQTMTMEMGRFLTEEAEKSRLPPGEAIGMFKCYFKLEVSPT